MICSLTACADGFVCAVLYAQVDSIGVRNFVDACVASGTVQKIVLQSSAGVESKAKGAGVGGFGGGGGQGAFLNKLFGDPLGCKVSLTTSVYIFMTSSFI
jgi:hypothetical protein